MMKPSNSDCLKVVLLQLASEGRGETLLGGCSGRAGDACEPFMIGDELPDAYLEFPLMGDPFLDVTLLYGDLEPGLHVDSPMAPNTDVLFDWYARTRAEYPSISFGFELDTSNPNLPPAGIHFQLRSETELVRPFFEALGEPERADLYLDLAQRMPKGWPLSFFGLFRGRPDSPMRVCGYLKSSEKEACVSDPAHLAEAFDAVGFSAYDERMLEEAVRIMAAAPSTLDFQFDVYLDGHLSDVFAFDVQFGIEQPHKVLESFESGPVYRVMSLLESLGVVDERWHLAAHAAFARSIPIEDADGEVKRLAFTLLPQWLKTRWKAGVLQPSKLYYLGRAGILDMQE